MAQKRPTEQSVATSIKRPKLKNLPNFSSHLINVVEYSRIQHTLNQYASIKKQGILYSVGDTVRLNGRILKDPHLIARLTGIFTVPLSVEQLPIIRFHIYYTVGELPVEVRQYVSQYEVFECQEAQFYGFAESIVGPCVVTDSYDEYTENILDPKTLQEKGPTYFTRGRYDSDRNEFSPPIEKWARGCVCNRPLNMDLEYIQCDLCDLWVHATCARMSLAQAQNMRYYCGNCKRKKGYSK